MCSRDACVNQSAGLLTVAAENATQFPLQHSRSKRFLVDQESQPFLYHADTCWMLFLRLTLAEAEEYMRARQTQGFNTIQVQLTGFYGMTNRDGHLPFANNDFAQPDPSYFEHVDAVVDKAREMNLLLAVAPLWSGAYGEGWAGEDKEGELKPMNVNGPEKCGAFGRWLGERYGKCDNFVWILGGDNDPDNAREEILALALNLKNAAPNHLLTYHASSSHSSTEVWPKELWIDLPMVYTYFRGFNKAWNKDQPDVYEVAWKEYERTPTRPFILGESTYEGEHDEWGSPLQTRKQAYWAILSGAAGHAYGSPNWNVPSNWREQLQREGANTLRHLLIFFKSIDWWRLIPDHPAKFATTGAGQVGINDLAVTAVSEDRTFAATYFPSSRKITYELGVLARKEISVSWFNPRTGEYSSEGHFGTTSSVDFEPPAEGDWVLVFL